MATTPVSQTLNRGGAFLISASAPEDIFTPADLTDDQRLIGQTAEEFVTKEVVPLIPDLEQHKEGLMPQLLKKAGDLGLLGGGIPEAYGGSGLDKISATLLAEKLAGYASFAVSHGAHAGIGTVPIVYFGTEEQKKKYLPKIATGELLSCYCLSEPQAGSDALASRTRAVLSPDGKNWLLSGQKMWITNGGFADVYVVFAKVDGEKFSCFIVERGASGFSVGAEEKKMGIRGSSTVPLFFENTPVPKENLLHEIGRGHIVAFNTLNVGRFSLGAYCLGGAKQALQAAAKYSVERTAFGKRLCDFGLIQSKLAEMALRIYAVESMIYRSAGMIEAAVEGPAAASADKTQQAMKVLEEYAIESSISKVAGSETLDFCVDEAVQIFGGYGFHEDYPVARAYRDSRINRIFEGTNEINRMLIIQMLMKRAMTGVLPLIPAAMKLSEEVLAGPSFEESPSGAFAEQERSLTQSKKIFLLAAGTAVQKFREQLADQQEIVASLSDIVMDIYAMESSLRRAQKASPSGSASITMADAARVFIYDAVDRIEKSARTALSAVAEGDALTTQLAVLRRFAKHPAVNTVALRRSIANSVLAQNRYPFESR
jgi:alkylation response protein AidB-like acyl-CoA dehydrogenase